MEIAVMVTGKKLYIFFIEFESIWSGKAWDVESPNTG